MKKIIMLFVYAAVSVFLVGNCAVAQKLNNLSYTSAQLATVSADAGLTTGEVKPINRADVKKIKAAIKTAKLNLRINRFLSANFKDISDLKIYTENKLVIATFKMKEKSARVTYNNKGMFLHSVINYSEPQMPADVRGLVAKEYKNYSISLVQEIQEKDATVFLVHLENEKNYEKVWVYNSNIVSAETFEKAN